MRRLLLIVLLAAALSASAQKRMDVLIDVEGVRRTGSKEDFTPNQIRYDPEFSTGGGIGGGINLFLSDRISIEGKVAVLVTDLRIAVVGSDFVAIADLGREDIYPIMATLQWHMVERGALRPYIGVGAAHIILRNIEDASLVGGATGVRFKDPTGLLLNAGVRLEFSSRWSAYADGRYIPIESTAEAEFVGTESRVRLDVKPLIVAFGLAYHF